jgi:dihydropteroate synthase
MAEAGASIVDVGGESTRPGSEPVPTHEELRRVLPVVEALGHLPGLTVSIDTTKPEVARRALEAGARMVNDISALAQGPALAALSAEYSAELVLMHMRGTPRTMQRDTCYQDLMGEVLTHLESRVLLAEAHGLTREHIIVDPGFGFGKSPAGNMLLLRRLREFTALGCRVLVGPSRKSTLGHALGGAPADQRLEATAAAVTAAVLNGAAIVRVHDVPEMSRVVRTADAILGRVPLPSA